MDGKDESSIVFTSIAELMAFLLFAFMLGFGTVTIDYKNKIASLQGDLVDRDEIAQKSQESNAGRAYCWPRSDGKVGTNKPLIKVYRENSELIVCPNMDEVEWLNPDALSEGDKKLFLPVASSIAANFGKPINWKSFTNEFRYPNLYLAAKNINGQNQSRQCVHGALAINRGDDLSTQSLHTTQEHEIWKYYHVRIVKEKEDEEVCNSESETINQLKALYSIKRS